MCWGNGQGGFAEAAYVGAMHGEGGLAPVDLNNDGKLDVATTDGHVLLNYGNGQFQFQNQHLLSGRAVAAGDFTGDGNPDLVVAGENVLAVLARSRRR